MESLINQRLGGTGVIITCDKSVLDMPQHPPFTFCCFITITCTVSISNAGRFIYVWPEKVEEENDCILWRRHTSLQNS